MIWRWHFYAGLFVLPFILVLSVTGAAYLFKPQLDRWEERAWRGLPAEVSVSPDAQLASALAANPGASFRFFRLPEAPGDAAVVNIARIDGSIRDVAVGPDGKVLGASNPEERISAWLSSVHSSLLLGRAGRIVVELAASWTIVMILTGLYLWWPRGRGPAGIVWPRFSLGGRARCGTFMLWSAFGCLVSLSSS